MSYRTPLIVAAVYAALFIALCCYAGTALGAVPDNPACVLHPRCGAATPNPFIATCANDAPCWTWPTMGNHKRGVVDATGTRRVVGPCQYARLAHRNLLDTRRTPRLRGDYLAQRIGCTARPALQLY